MNPFKNNEKEPVDDGQDDAALADPKVDYEPSDHEAQSGPNEPVNPGG